MSLHASARSAEHTDHAVVIGAGMGGLTIARVLSETYQQVTVLDRDVLPARVQPRKGTPQDRHLHVLLYRGLQALDELFSGFSDELSSLGAPSGDLQETVRVYNDGQMVAPARSDLLTVSVSRPFVEHLVRQRVGRLSNIKIVDECYVVGIAATDNHDRVTGVRTRTGKDAAETTIPADLVVDASGRGSRSHVWLEQLGYGRVAEDQIWAHITYVTRHFRRPPDARQSWLGSVNPPFPGQLRGACLFAEEDDRWGLTLMGMVGEQPPLDHDAMLEFAQGLAASEVAQLLRTAEPIDAPVKMHYPASVRRRYEQMRRFPAGYLVAADALCGFNPVYAQGMTVAALEAVLLRRLLAEGSNKLARRFFREVVKLLESPWSISTGNDLRFPKVEGERTMTMKLLNRYLARYHRAAVHDPVLGAAFIRAANLLDSPRSLLAPGLVMRVLRGSS